MSTQTSVPLWSAVGKQNEHEGSLLGRWEILCTNLTEWLLQKTQVVVRGECCGRGCQTSVVLG